MMYGIALNQSRKDSVYPDEGAVPRSTEYKILNDRMSEFMMQWREKLSTADFQAFEELIELKNDMNSLQSQESFVHGFKLGSLMMIEVYTNTEKLIRR